MNNELLKERQRRKRSMSGKNLDHIFVIGIICDICNESNIEAVKLYDIKKKEASIQSIDIIKQRLENGEKIIGLHLRYKLQPNKKISSQIVFEKGAYNCLMTDKLNGKGEIIKPQKSVLIGIRETEEKDYLIVMNGNCDMTYISKEEAIEQRLNGVTNRGLICINSYQKII